ncbi:MAG: FadR family transcriptional regulator [Acidobacteriota bacterium]|nr:FadR family transcriptional regulator [Acidobacteriota bacterium]
MSETNQEIFKLSDGEKTGTTAEEVVASLREMIHRGELKLGDRLPPERDLAKQLGVSRPTLRAGIRSLAAVGVLKSRQGAGTFIVEADASPALDSNPLRLMASLNGFSSAEMFEARLLLEMAITGLAAERASSEHLAALAEELAEMFATLDEPEEYLVHDMRFHQLIAAASGNRIITALMNMVASILFDVRSKTVHRAHDLKESAEMHRQIFRSIREGNTESARNAMRDHLLLAQKAQSEEIAETFGANGSISTTKAKKKNPATKRKTAKSI